MSYPLIYGWYDTDTTDPISHANCFRKFALIKRFNEVADTLATTFPTKYSRCVENIHCEIYSHRTNECVLWHDYHYR